MAVPFTSLNINCKSTRFAVPSIISIPPPARFAPFEVSAAELIFNVPEVLKIAPPDPEVPVAILLKISAKESIFIVPPSL